MVKLRKTHLNQALREERLSRGWSQSDLAELLDVTVITISRWERGITFPSAYFRSKICNLFQKSTQELGLLSEERVALRASKNDAPYDVTPDLYDPALPVFLETQPLIGRSRLVELLTEQLCTGVGSYAITGLPGVGKTALIAALVHHPQIRQHFQDGILWVGLGSKPQMVEHMNRWGKLLDPTTMDKRTLTTLDAWARYLHESIGNRRLLLIIDDVWQLAEALAFRIGNSRCVHILTTRSPAIARSFAPKNVIHLRELNEGESLTLLMQWIEEASNNFNIRTRLRNIVRLVGGLPLALTLVSRYLHIQEQSGQPRRLQAALERLCQNVEDRLYLAEPQVPWEHATSWPIGTALSLQATIELSIQHLPAKAQAALYALSIFPPKPQSFSEEAALSVCHTIETLDILVDCGLLECTQSGRYQVHQTIADYAQLHRVDPASAG